MSMSWAFPPIGSFVRSRRTGERLHVLDVDPEAMQVVTDDGRQGPIRLLYFDQITEELNDGPDPATESGAADRPAGPGPAAEG